MAAWLCRPVQIDERLLANFVERGARRNKASWTKPWTRHDGVDKRVCGAAGGARCRPGFNQRGVLKRAETKTVHPHLHLFCPRPTCTVVRNVVPNVPPRSRLSASAVVHETRVVTQQRQGDLGWVGSASRVHHVQPAMPVSMPVSMPVQCQSSLNACRASISNARVARGLAHAHRYGERWLTLLIIIVLQIANAMLWITYSPIANLAASPCFSFPI